MPIIARSPTRRRFVPPSQRDDKDPFAVWFRPDDKDVQIQIENIRTTLGISEDADTPEEVREQLKKEDRQVSFAWEYLRIFLDGWENMVDVDGTPTEFERDESGQPTDKTVSKIPMLIRGELFNELTSRTQLSKGERKNSE